MMLHQDTDQMVPHTIKIPPTQTSRISKPFSYGTANPKIYLNNCTYILCIGYWCSVLFLNRILSSFGGCSLDSGIYQQMAVE